MPIDNPGLPLPPDRRRIPASRISPLRDVLSKYARLAAARRAPLPRFAPFPIPKTPQKQPPIPGQKYRPPESGKAWTANPREILALIARFARDHKVIILRYRALKHGNQVVSRAVEPYAIRLKDTKVRGRARYFYGYDAGDGNPTVGIHAFLVPNIVSIQGTDKTYTPRYTVEF